jgi:hypothetical protein
MIIATLIGVPLGLAIGASRWGRLLTGLTIDFLRPIPSVALIPILVLVYGTSPTLKVTLAVFGATFPLVFQAMYGMTDVDPVAKGHGPRLRHGPVDPPGPRRAAQLRALPGDRPAHLGLDRPDPGGHGASTSWACRGSVARCWWPSPARRTTGCTPSSWRRASSA